MSLKYWDDNGQNISLLFKLFDSWDTVLHKYDNAWGNYIAPQVYIQQTQVGYLAIAARDIGWLPQLEFSIERKTAVGSYKKGRCDLALWRKNRGQITEIYFEVESCWYTVKINPKRVEEVSNHLKKTQEDVKCIREARGLPGIGLVLVRLCEAPLPYNPSGLWSRIQVIRKKLNADFCSLHVRKEKCRKRTPKVEGRDCLGIAAFGCIKGQL